MMHKAGTHAVIRAALANVPVWRVILPRTPECIYRWVRGVGASTAHPNAPQGMSYCRFCKRIVVRGSGRWWVR